MSSVLSRHRTFVVSTFLCAALCALPAQANTVAELDELAVRAGEVFRELGRTPDRSVPADLIARSYCVAAIPNVIKAAWVLGGRYGQGLLSCRSKSGDWSPPVHVVMSGGSVGLQVGVSSTDVVLFFMTPGSVRSLLTNKIKLSGEAGVAAGPYGREAEAATDGNFTAQIYSYARSRGAFAGMALAGGYLGVDEADTATWYGKAYTPANILFDRKVTRIPKSAWMYLSALPRPKAPPKSTAKTKRPAPKTAARKPAPKPAAKPAPAQEAATAAPPPAAASAPPQATTTAPLPGAEPPADSAATAPAVESVPPDASQFPPDASGTSSGW